MATLEFESHPPLFPSAAVSGSPFRHPSRGARKRLALISTYDDLCGIAAYTRSLEKQLNEIFDVTVFDLDQYLLRSAHSRVRKFGDKHIQDICREIREFDAVNLQLEHGTLGRSCRDIHRRFSWILRAAPRCSVTFHTIFQCEAFDFRGFINEMLRLNFAKAIAMRSAYNRKHLLSAGIASRLRRAQRFKPVTLIVHTGRDLSHMKFVHGMRNVHDHPLASLSPGFAGARKNGLILNDLLAWAFAGFRLVALRTAFVVWFIVWINSETGRWQERRTGYRRWRWRGRASLAYTRTD